MCVQLGEFVSKSPVRMLLLHFMEELARLRIPPLFQADCRPTLVVELEALQAKAWSQHFCTKHCYMYGYYLLLPEGRRPTVLKSDVNGPSCAIRIIG